MPVAKGGGVELTPAPQGSAAERRPGASGFTLIELLVVVAILALLTAFLFPALSRARASGKATQCIGNQKQLNLALQVYASDNSGYLPPYGDIGAYDPARWWYVLIGPYLREAPYQFMGYNHMRCAAAPTDLLWCYGVNYGYGTNSVFAYEGNPPNFGGSQNIAQLSPAAMLTADSVSVPIFSPAIWPMGSVGEPGALYNNFDPRHDDHAVCGFADGSARKVSRADWLSNQGGLWNP